MAKKSNFNQEAADLIKLSSIRPLNRDEFNTIQKSSYKRLTEFYSGKDEFYLKEFNLFDYINSNLTQFKFDESKVNFYPFYTIQKPLFEGDTSKLNYGVLYQMNDLPVGYFKKGITENRKRKAILIENLENFINSEHYIERMENIHEYEVIYTRGVGFFDIGHYKEVICFFDWDFAGLQYYSKLKLLNKNCSFYVDDDYLAQANTHCLKSSVKKTINGDFLSGNAKYIYDNFYLKGYKVFQESFLLINQPTDSHLYEIERIKNSSIESLHKGKISKQEILIKKPNGYEEFMLLERGMVSAKIRELQNKSSIILVHDIQDYFWLTRYFSAFNLFNPREYYIVYTNKKEENHTNNKRIRNLNDWYATALYNYFCVNKKIPFIEYFLSFKNYTNIKTKSMNKLLKIQNLIQREENKQLFDYIIKHS
jgi:5S rRNA maturation endonuclease (ribonuclease M5)